MKGTGNPTIQPPTRSPFRPIRSENPADPAAEKGPLPPDPVEKPPRRQVRKGLDEPETHDERQDDTLGGQPELPLRDERQERPPPPPQPPHPPDEGVDQNEEGELGKVLPKPQDGCGVGKAGRPAVFCRLLGC